MTNESSPQPKKSKKTKILTAVIGSLSTLILALAGFIAATSGAFSDICDRGILPICKPDPTRPVDNGTPTTPTSESSDAPSTSTDTPTSETPEVTSDPDVSQETTIYLAELGAVSTEKEGRAGRCTGGCTGFGPGSGGIKGKSYSRSYLMEVASDGRRSTAKWNLKGQCSELNGTFGLADDNSDDAQVTFTLQKDDGLSKDLAVVSLSNPGTVENVDVSGAAQIEIAAFVSGGDPNSDLDVVLGEAYVTCTSNE